MRQSLLLQHECHRLWLTPGARIACRRGCLWLTLETHHAGDASPDIVLEAGQQYPVRVAGHYFLTHLGQNRPAQCEVLPGAVPAGLSGRRWLPRWT